MRALAADYGVAHTTLGRYFARPEVARQLREARRAVQAERRALAARRAGERREVRRRAKEQAALARERARRAAAASRSAARRPRRSGYAAWLDERDGRLPLTRTDLRSGSDELAERAVAAGGGIEAVIEATGLRTRENVQRLIDPAILVRALENEAAAAAAAEPERDRLRRLVPDHQLLRRRAAGEPLRRLAAEYGVAHTTLGRWFARPEVARQLRELTRRLPRYPSRRSRKQRSRWRLMSCRDRGRRSSPPRCERPPAPCTGGPGQPFASSRAPASIGSRHPSAASARRSARCELSTVRPTLT